MPTQRKQRCCGYIQKNVALASGGHEVLMTVTDMGPAKVGLGNMNIKGECLCYRFWGALDVTRLKSRVIAEEFGIQ